MSQTKTYSYDEAYKNCLTYFKGDELAAGVMVNKYLLQDREGNYLENSPEQTLRRCAKEFARIEKKYKNPLSEDEIYNLLKDFKYIIPQGSPLYGIGNDTQYTSLSNCFVIGQPVDSYGGILRKDEELAQLMKRRGGVGIDISTLRPRGMGVSGAAKTSDGIEVFMERYSNTTQEVAQGGRRGALMISIDCRHPQIEDFIKIKTDLGKVNGANISVKWSDDFILAVKDNKKYTLRFPVNASIEEAQVTKEVNARDIWNLFIKANHKSAEPGCLFWDTIINNSIADCYKDVGMETISTNPCLTSDMIINAKIYSNLNSYEIGDYTIEQLLHIFKRKLISPYKIEVLSYNEKTKEKEYKKLLNIFKSRSNTNIMKLEIENFSDLTNSNTIYTLKCTPDHKIYDSCNLDYIEAKDLRNNKLIFNNEKCNRDDCYGKTNSLYKIKKYFNYGIEDVYDLTVEDNHNFFANGILVHNCAEEPLAAYSSCILMIINLTSFINKPFANDAFFDKELFKEITYKAVRLIDDMIDLEIEKVDRIINFIKNNADESTRSVELNLWENIRHNHYRTRRVGLGVTGLGDMLAYMNIKYGSEEAIKFIEEVFKDFHNYSYLGSSILAMERKPFLEYNYEKEKDCHYIDILPESTKQHIKQYGRRNITLNTCAPAGSISLLTGTTSGIEPVFKREYVRNRKMTIEELNRGIKPSYVDDKGISWISFKVNHPGVKLWKEIHSDKDIKESPYYESEAGELDYNFRVDIQAVMQTYIDASISSTANLPENITIDQVSSLYLRAWEKGCKGITIYREGSRKGVLVDINKDNKNDIIYHDAPTRPDILPCDIHYATIGKETWVLFVGLLNGKPYDIFGGSKSNIEIPKKYKKGWIKKNKSVNNNESVYDLILGTIDESEDRMIIKDISKVFNCNMGSYTRIISMSLRHGISIKFICEQLYKDNASDMFTFEKGMARVLKKYIKDGEKANSVCEKCGSKNMIYSSGCAQCADCGYSKCN